MADHDVSSRTYLALLRCLATALLLIGVANCAAAADTGSTSFYKDKTLTVIVPYGPGGHFDSFARLIGRHIEQYLPVEEVKVVNRPGAGGLIGANAIYNAKADGLTVGVIQAAGDVFAQIDDAPGVRFDMTKFSWIGRPDDDPLVIVTQKDGDYKTFDDLVDASKNDTPLAAMATGKGGISYNTSTIIYNAFGIPYHVVSVPGGTHQTLATFLSGNGDSVIFSSSTLMQSLSERGNFLTTVTAEPFDRLPSTTTLLDEAKQHDLSDERITVLRTMIKILGMGRAFVAPPGTSSDKLDVLRTAFKKTVADASFRKEAEKSGLFIGYGSPESLKAQVEFGLGHKSLLLDYLH